MESALLSLYVFPFLSLCKSVRINILFRMLKRARGNRMVRSSRLFKRKKKKERLKWIFTKLYELNEWPTKLCKSTLLQFQQREKKRNKKRDEKKKITHEFEAEWNDVARNSIPDCSNRGIDSAPSDCRHLGREWRGNLYIPLSGCWRNLRCWCKGGNYCILWGIFVPVRRRSQDPQDTLNSSRIYSENS